MHHCFLNARFLFPLSIALAGVKLRTSTRPSVNLLLLPHASVLPLSIHAEGRSCSDLGSSACGVIENKHWTDRRVIENKHSTDVESPSPPPNTQRVCRSIHPEGKSCGHVRYRFECLFSMTLLRGGGLVFKFPYFAKYENELMPVLNSGAWALAP